MVNWRNWDSCHHIVNLNFWSDNINLEFSGCLAHRTTSIERVLLLKFMRCSFRRSWSLNFLKLQI
jgi:hypothetical protein